jgi:hypothetical protein
MSEPAFDWETCNHTEISASMAVSIVERVAGEDNELAEEIKDEIHKHASGMMMARGKRRAPRSYR